MDCIEHKKKGGIKKTETGQPIKKYVMGHAQISTQEPESKCDVDAWCESESWIVCGRRGAALIAVSSSS